MGIKKKKKSLAGTSGAHDRRTKSVTMLLDVAPELSKCWENEREQPGHVLWLAGLRPGTTIREQGNPGNRPCSPS
jgi:hypothetical protein